MPPRTSRRELSPLQRAEIIGAHKAGVLQAHIARTFNLPEATVRYTVNLASKRVDHRSQPRGRPRKTTKADDDLLEREALADPSRSFRSLQSDSPLSRQTIKRRLKERSVTKQPAAQTSSSSMPSSDRVSRRNWTFERSSVASRNDVRR
ncbi:MAG: hypothetical protein M1817_002526 [Caeruleum heppii]|nr:MAG: hypothetical protein M1817_002526 [Caeruleum heppii]